MTTVTRTLLSKRFNEQTTAVHVRYVLNICTFFAVLCKQQREITKFCAVYGTYTTTASFSHFHLELYAVVAYLA